MPSTISTEPLLREMPTTPLSAVSSSYPTTPPPEYGGSTTELLIKLSAHRQKIRDLEAGYRCDIYKAGACSVCCAPVCGCGVGASIGSCLTPSMLMLGSAIGGVSAAACSITASLFVILTDHGRFGEKLKKVTAEESSIAAIEAQILGAAHQHLEIELTELVEIIDPEFVMPRSSV